MIYFYDDVDTTNSIRISNSEIAELDLVAKIKESDLDKYFKKYLKKDTNVWFYYDLPYLAEDYDCKYEVKDEFGLWYIDEDVVESKKSAKNSIKESINGDCYIYYDDDDGKRNVFCDYVKGITDTRNWFYLNEYIIDAIHIFKNEKQAQKFIDEDLKYFADQDKVVIAEYPQTVSGFFESKKSVRKSINEANESVIINGKKTNFKINDYGTFFGEKIKYMLIGKPLENKDVLIDFLEENSNFEFKEYKNPYSIVYYIYNDEKSLFGVAYSHYIRLTNNEKDAKIMLAYATDKSDLYNGL